MKRIAFLALLAIIIFSGFAEARVGYPRQILDVISVTCEKWEASVSGGIGGTGSGVVKITFGSVSQYTQSVAVCKYTYGWVNDTANTDEEELGPGHWVEVSWDRLIKKDVSFEEGNIDSTSSCITVGLKKFEGHISVEEKNAHYTTTKVSDYYDRIATERVWVRDLCCIGEAPYNCTPSAFGQSVYEFTAQCNAGGGIVEEHACSELLVCGGCLVDRLNCPHKCTQASYDTYQERLREAQADNTATFRVPRDDPDGTEYDRYMYGHGTVCKDIPQCVQYRNSAYALHGNDEGRNPFNEPYIFYSYATNDSVGDNPMVSSGSDLACVSKLTGSSCGGGVCSIDCYCLCPSGYKAFENTATDPFFIEQSFGSSNPTYSNFCYRDWDAWYGAGEVECIEYVTIQWDREIREPRTQPFSPGDFCDAYTRWTYGADYWAWKDSEGLFGQRPPMPPHLQCGDHFVLETLYPGSAGKTDTNDTYFNPTDIPGYGILSFASWNWDHPYPYVSFPPYQYVLNHQFPLNINEEVRSCGASVFFDPGRPLCLYRQIGCFKLPNATQIPKNNPRNDSDWNSSMCSVSGAPFSYSLGNDSESGGPSDDSNLKFDNLKISGLGYYGLTLSWPEINSSELSEDVTVYVHAVDGIHEIHINQNVSTSASLGYFLLNNDSYVEVSIAGSGIIIAGEVLIEPSCNIAPGITTMPIASIGENTTSYYMLKIVSNERGCPADAWGMEVVPETTLHTEAFSLAPYETVYGFINFTEAVTNGSMILDDGAHSYPMPFKLAEPKCVYRRPACNVSIDGIVAPGETIALNLVVSSENDMECWQCEQVSVQSEIPDGWGVETAYDPYYACPEGFGSYYLSIPEDATGVHDITFNVHGELLEGKCSIPIDLGGYSIQGIVIDRDGEPLENASILLLKFSSSDFSGTSAKVAEARTGGSGRYIIDDELPVGAYKITACYTGAMCETHYQFVAAGYAYTHDFTLREIPALYATTYYSGWNKPYSTPRGLPGMSCALKDSSGNVVFQRTTDSDGRFRIYAEDVAAPLQYDVEYRIYCTKDGYTQKRGYTQSQDYPKVTLRNITYTTMSSSNSVLVYITDAVANPSTLKVYFRDTSGTPVKNTQMALFRRDTGARNTYSGSGDYYTVSGLPAGEYNVTASKAGYIASSVIGIAVPESAAVDSTVVMTPSCVFSGTVTNSAGKALAGTKAELIKDGLVFQTKTISYPSSRYEFNKDIPAGAYQVKAYASGYQSQAQDVSCATGEKKAVNFVLSKG